MNFGRIYAMFLRQIFLMRHNPLRFVNIFVWGFVDVVIWGFLTRYLDSVQQLDFSFVPVLLGAVLLWNFLVRVHQGTIISTLEDVWSRNFLNLFASPLRIKEYIGGLILTSIATSLAAIILLTVIAALFFGYNLLSMGPALFVFLSILFLFGGTLGIFSSALILRFGPSAEWVSWIIPALILPFTGVFYPVAALPFWLESIAKLLPTTYAFESMRNLVLGNPLDGLGLWIGLGLGLLYFILMCLIYIRVYRTVLKNGLLARFSAESMSG